MSKRVRIFRFQWNWSNWPFDPACADMMRKLSDYDKSGMLQKCLYLVKTLIAIPVSSCCCEHGNESFRREVHVTGMTVRVFNENWYGMAIRIFVVNMLKALIATPISPCCCECSYSASKRLKTWQIDSIAWHCCIYFEVLMFTEKCSEVCKCEVPPDHLHSLKISFSGTGNIPNLKSYIYRIAPETLHSLCVYIYMVAQLHAH